MRRCFVPLDTVSVLSCIEMKGVGRGERASCTGLRPFCTSPEHLPDDQQAGEFRSSRMRDLSRTCWKTSIFFLSSKECNNAELIYLNKEQAAVLFRQWSRS